MTVSVPVLLYHSIDGNRSSLSTDPRVFRRHMQWLHACGWQSLSLDEFAYYVRSQRALPPRTFVLTFDDGYESVALEAAPVLAEFGFTAACFLCTSMIRKPLVENVPPDVGVRRFLSWDQVRDLQQRGLVEFQSHTHTHESFKGRPLRDLVNDLGASLDLLSQALRLPRTKFVHLAWPWGHSDTDERRAAAKCGLRYQYSVARQSFHVGSDMQAIPRTCYDGASFLHLQIQLWLQTGMLGDVWHASYPVLRRLRRRGNDAEISEVHPEPDVQDIAPSRKTF